MYYDIILKEGDKRYMKSLSKQSNIWTSNRRDGRYTRALLQVVFCALDPLRVKL